MIKKLKIIVLIVLCISLTACSTAKVEPSNNNNKVEDKPKEDIEIKVNISDEFDKLVVSEAKIDEVKSFVDENIHKANEALADKMLFYVIDLMYNSMEAEVEYFYGENSHDVQTQIVTAYEVGKDKYERSYVFVGKDRYTLLKDMRDESVIKHMKLLFDRGYGINSGEGTFYPIIDYKNMKNNYINSVSEATAEYLDIMACETDDPTIIEEFLSVEIEELRYRAWRYEEFLDKNSDLSIVEDIRMKFLVCIWKLVSPNPFDGMLNEDYTVTKELDLVYKSILDDNNHPVTYDAVKGIIKFIEEKDGVLGSYSGMDEAYEIASDLHYKAMQQVEEIYLKK